MTTIILLFIILVIWHFIYQAILLPTLRLRLRFELFKIRDKVRKLKIDEKEVFSDEAYYFTENSVNSLLQNLHFIEFSTLVEAKKFFNSNKKASERIEKIEEVFSNCASNKVSEIHNDISTVFILTLFANSGSWIIYIVPIVLIALTFGGIKRLVEKMLFLSDGDYDKILTNKDIALT